MYEDALARVDLFSGLRKKELQEVATYFREGTHSPGSVLISQGEKGLGLFLLIKGTVRIIGEMALLDDLPRSATVTALDEVTVLVLPFWEFRIVLRDILRRDPDVGLDLLAVLSRRLRKCEQRAYE